MARIRTIKPEFFKHQALFDAEVASGLPLRLAFAGLWTICDREGRFEWRPRAIKTDVLPYDELDFPSVLDALVAYGFLVKYRVNDKDYGFVPGFARHQVVNNRETASRLPDAPREPGKIEDLTREARVTDVSGTRHDPAHGEGKGTEEERKGREALSNSDPAQDPARISNVRGAIISALGLTGREVNTSGTFIVGGMGEHDLSVRLAIWDQLELDDEQIVMVIKATFARQRQTEPAWLWPAPIEWSGFNLSA